MSQDWWIGVIFLIALLAIIARAMRVESALTQTQRLMLPKQHMRKLVISGVVAVAIVGAMSFIAAKFVFWLAN